MAHDHSIHRTSLAPQRWSRLMPAVFLTYSLAYLDRVNFGFAASGMKQELGLDANQIALLGALFFLGYFFFQVPSANYARRRSATRLVCWALIAWSILAALTGILSNFWLLAIDRFALGIAESVVMPAMLVFLTHWFTKGERSRANTFLILGNPVTVLWMSAITGFLVGAVGWRWMFILEAIPSLVWSFVWLKIANDHPRQSNWIPRDEAFELEHVLDREQTGIAPVRNYWQAFRKRRVVILSAQYFFWSLGVYGFVIWLPSIIEAGSAQGAGISGLLTSLPYVLAVILMIAASYYSDRTLKRKLFVWPFLLVGAIAFIGSYLIGGNHFWLSFLLLVIAGGCMYAPYGPFFAIVPEILPQNVSGEAMALINSLGALGSFVGAYFVGWLNGVTGGPGAGFVAMAIALFIAVLLTLIVKMPRASDKSRPPLSPANIER